MDPISPPVIPTYHKKWGQIKMASYTIITNVDNKGASLVI